MGIRIHKTIGWGVDNFEKPKDFHKIINKLWDTSKEEFATWLEANKEPIKQLCVEHFRKYNESSFNFQWTWTLHNLKKSVKEVGNSVTYDDEYGLNAILFCPFELHKVGRRYDDLIDYLEEDPQVNRWKKLNRGIHPFLQGEKPVSVIAVCLFLKLEYLIPSLHEALYIYWS